MVGSRKQVIDSCEWLGKSEVYRLDDKRVVKFIKNISEYEDSLEVQYGLRTNSFVFPSEKFFEFDTNQYIGYVMDYVNGIDVIKHDFNDIRELVTSIKLLEEDLNIINTKHLVIVDFENYNALYDIINNLIRVIDTTKYEYYKEISVEGVRQTNLKTYNDFMIKLLSISNDFTKRKLYQVCSKLGNRFTTKYELFNYGHIPFSELVTEIKDQTKILTLQDLNKI